MSTPVTESGNRDAYVPPQLAPPEDPREIQEVLWEKMKVRAETPSGNWKELAPEQRVSREGFRPLVSRISASNLSASSGTLEGEAALNAAQRYQEELKVESSRAEEMLQHLDELETHLHALHASNDTSEELSILISYVRLEKATVQSQMPMDGEGDAERQAFAVLGSNPGAQVDPSRLRPTSAVRKSSESGSSTSEETPDELRPGADHERVRPVTKQQ